ncbi:hypothetical protein [Streptomyces sp. NPDC054783]
MSPGTAVSSMTTAYLGTKAVSSTARSIALGQHSGTPAATPRTPAASAAAPPAQRTL